MSPRLNVQKILHKSRCLFKVIVYTFPDREDAPSRLSSSSLLVVILNVQAKQHPMFPTATCLPLLFQAEVECRVVYALTNYCRRCVTNRT
jgi:hypothetical protein